MKKFFGSVIKDNIIFIIGISIYLEILLQFFIYSNISNVPLKIIYCLQIAIIFKTLSSLFSEKINKIITGGLIILISLIYCIHYIYYKTFGSVLSLYTISRFFQVTQFKTSISNVIINNLWAIILMLIPIFIYFIFKKKFSCTRISKKKLGIFVIILIVLYFITILIISTDKKEEMYSSKNLYYYINNSVENLKKFGLCTTIRLEIQRKIFGFEEKILYEYKDESGNIKILNSKEYNISDINFDELIESKKDETIKEISEYLKTEEPTKKNKYTGIFEGKNLIFIIGESFSSLAINKEVAPTLYKLANSGIVFENFYTPLFPVSTADGEYLTDNSLLPAENTWSIEKVAGNYMPYSYANLLENKGYKTYSYHNYKYDYYNRDKYLETMGYDTYLAWGNGLEERMDFSKSISSDYDMIKATVPDYINEEKFLAYYVTISGHMDYDNKNNNVVKNWEQVENLPYSDKCKGYLATQIELDKALEELINSLKSAGKLDDTVIVMCGDHYPYGLTESEIKELLPYDGDYNFEKFHMPLIIYNSKMETTKVEKYGSSLDILPTVLNLFGLEYDSRLLIGKDILSDVEPLVIFSNRSFITQNEKYDSLKRKLYRNGEKVTDSDYVSKITQKIYYKYRYSRLILETDYYRKIFN